MTEMEENLKKLTKTSILTNFIKKHNCNWNHSDWLELCDKVSVKYSPIDFNELGSVLEKKRQDFLKSQS